MSDREMWPEDQGAAQAGGAGAAPEGQGGMAWPPHRPYGPAGGQYGPPSRYGPMPPHGPTYPSEPGATYPTGQPYGPGAPYGPQPPYGQPLPGYGGEPARAPQRSRALRSASAVLVVAAAALAGAGVSRVIWPADQSSSTAAPPVTSPSGGNQSPETLPGGGASGAGSSAEGAGGPSDVSAIAAAVDPAVVDVNVAFNYQDVGGAGTGIVLTPAGLVLTNNHVIDEATKVSVTDVGNGKTYPATVLGYDNTHDVALIQLQGASGLTTAKLSSTPASIGEAVVAIGNAGGTGGTPTSAGGSVTALNQKILANDELTEEPEPLSGLIEDNANVEEGDSGGPLVSSSGQVVGMDTAASENFSFSAQGNQGFAIPISYAMQIVKQIESGKGTSTVHVGATAFLGLLLDPPGGSSYSTYSPFGGTSNSFGGSTQTTSNGLEVNNVVSGAPAQLAGVTTGDVITTFNGTKLSSGEQLTKLLVGYHPGQKVKFGWLTPDGAAHSATVRLASGPPS